MTQPPAGDDWVEATHAPLPVGDALSWLVRPACGALCVFCGTVRDHSDGRPGVVGLEYEAYLEQVGPRLERIVATARQSWPGTGRLVVLHRLGRLSVGESSVVVGASTAHRAEAFDVARFCIEAVKESVPIWKRETWDGGSDWGLCSHDVVDIGEAPTPGHP